MGNVLRILLRDFKRLLKAPAALIVVGALMVLPSIYTWYNVAAFWNPYEATGNLSVCVVNQDSGTSTEMTGQLDVGDKLIEELQENDQLHWVTDKDYDTAMEDLKVGNVYAVYVIPEDFSACLVSPLTGEVKNPHIDYFANEKLGPVSPKITDAAASALDQQINATFVSTVTEAATEAIDEAIKKAEADVSAAKTKATDRAEEAKQAFEEARKTLSSLEGTIGDARSKVAAAADGISGSSAVADDARAVLKDVTSEAEALQKSLAGVSSQSVPELSNVLSELVQVSAKASTLANSISSSASAAEADVDMAAAKIQPAIDTMREIASDLQTAASKISDESLRARLEQAAQDASARADEAQSILDGVTSAAEQAASASKTAAETAKTLNDAATQASSSFSQFSTALHGSVASTVDSSVAQIGSVCAALSAAVSDVDAAVGQVAPILGQLDGALADCGTAVMKTNALVGGIKTDLDSVMADARLLAQSDVIDNLLKNGTLNAQNISEFMGSPTELSTTKLYHPNAYGTAMAPLFMNLSFWIGAFMLMIIFLLEVDAEGFEELKLWQRYLGRFLMFCIFAVVQAIVCCAGALALGVQAANAPALFVAACVTSLAYLSIIYALSSTFRHVGKALCIVLVFAQIPGGAGLYPIELTSSFFQALSPFLPFTYGVDAMREAICGFYGNYYAKDLIVLGVFFFGSMGLGLLLGPLVSNVVRMTARQVHDGDLYNGADSLLPERPYRSTQVLRALTERGGYRKELEVRYARFSRWYPIFIRVSIVLGVGVPVVLAVLLALDAAEKVTLLTFFLFWLIGLIGFLVVVESMRYSFERQLSLEHMSNERLLRLFANRNRMTRVGHRWGAHGKPAADGENEDGEEQPPLGGFRKLQAASHARRQSAGGVRNIWLIARRDFSGLFKNVMSTVITIGLVALPSLFAWYNILACWNVFDNTNYLSVAVASEDEGFESDLLPVNVNIGEKVVSALRGNEQIHWVFTSPEDAVEGTKAGKYYAALVIPEGFSRDMLTFYEGDSASATINYYVNEKKNAIAPNIIGTDADMVSYEVNATFADTISEIAIGVAQSLSKVAEEGDADGRLMDLVEHMRDVANRLDQSGDVLGLYSTLGKDTQGLVQGSSDAVGSARGKLQEAASEIDAGKGQLQKLVNSLSSSVGDVKGSLGKAESAADGIAQRADALISDASEKLPDIASQLRGKASEVDAKVAELSEVLAALEELRDALQSGTSAQVDADISNGKANIKVDLGDGTVYQSEEALTEEINALTETIGALELAKDGLSEAEKTALQEKIDKFTDTKEKLQELLGSKTDATNVDIDAQLSGEGGALVENTIILDKDIAALKKAIEILQNASAACTETADSLEAAQADAKKQAASLRKLAKAVKSDVATVRKDLKNSLEPGAERLKSDIATLSGDLDRGVGKLRAIDPDLAGTLQEVAASLGGASAKIDEANSKLHTAAGRVRNLADAVDEALKSGDAEKLRSLLQGSAGDLAAALTAPVQIERTALFPSENFGSAMTPLYCTLAVFIGSLLIMVAMKPEVSRRGREKLVDPKPRHLFFGRFCPVALVSLMQTTLLGLGNMLFLKVQVASPILFMVGFWFSGLVLAFIVYSLVVAFGNLGKALSVLLLIVQVTACGGSYPLQILPDFVQAISPWVPATYIVNALRAAMMGVYHNDFWVALGHLALFIIPFLLLGLVLRKPMERFMKLYVSKVEECGIME